MNFMKQSATAATRGRKAKAANGSSQNKTARSSSATAQGRQAGQGGETRQGGQTNRRNSETTTGSGQANGRGSNEKGNNGDGRNMRTGNSNARAGTTTFEGTSYLEKFFLDQLQDIYYAEQKITQSLPKMQQAATTEELQEAFEDHLHQTQRHVKRLEKAFSLLGKKAEGKKCEAIEGIAREVESIISETEEGTMTRDAALIMAAQKVEHYEIATYGGLLQLAITMGEFEVAELLDRTLIEEEDTDVLLTDIAECDINLMAEHEGSRSSGLSGMEEEEGEGQEEEEGSGEDEGSEEEDIESGTEE
jgi:ferritin-like metal-binding protein YciE